MQRKEQECLDFVLRHYRKGRLDTRQAYRNFLSRYALREPSRRPWYAYAARVAAVVAVVLLIGGVYLRLHPVEKWVTLTADGYVKEVVLPDSSRIFLAPASCVRYEARSFGRKREVEMRGKVFFEVRRDPESPFSVRNGIASVRVLGTKFQVAESGALTTVWVQSGKVAFSALGGTDSLILTKGMSAVLEAGSDKPDRIGRTPPNPVAWQTGYFVYDDTPLETVLKELSGYYGVKLAASSGDTRLTGRFSTESLDEIIEIIESTLDIKIEK